MEAGEIASGTAVAVDGSVNWGGVALGLVGALFLLLVGLVTLFDCRDLEKRYFDLSRQGRFWEAYARGLGFGGFRLVAGAGPAFVGAVLLIVIVVAVAVG